MIQIRYVLSTFNRRMWIKRQIKSRAPGDRHDITRGLPAGCSEQTDPRHTHRSAYCCSRQGLTGFTGVHCTGPTRQRPLPAPYLTISCLKPGIQPCYSGLQVQGTAGSPSGTANFLSILFYFRQFIQNIFAGQHIRCVRDPRRSFV